MSTSASPGLIRATLSKIFPCMKLPYELMIMVFNFAVCSDPLIARQLVGVSRWIYDWACPLAYETVVVSRREHVRRARADPKWPLAHVRNAWFDISHAPTAYVLAKQLLAVQRLFIGLDKWDDLSTLLPPSAGTRLRQLYIAHRTVTLPLVIPTSNLRTLTHLRISPLTYDLTVQLTKEGSLPSLTHLAVDMNSWTVNHAGVRTNGSEYSSILSASCRETLRLLVVIVPKSDEDTWFFDAMLALDLERLWVLRDELDCSVRTEWLAECHGKPGFWQRVDLMTTVIDAT